MCIIDYKNLEEYCNGCGLCAGICLKNNIEMRVNQNGDLRAFKIDTCLSNCDLCKRVCPAMNTENIDIIAKKLFSSESNKKYNFNTGYYTNCFVGHVNNEKDRLSSASGGLTTWILKKLLEEDIIDRVVAVKSCSDIDNTLFKFEIFDKLDDILKSSGSAYYPVDISDAIKRIKDDGDLRYAVIGLPCVVFGIRQAQEVNSLLRKRIKFLFSLTCGQMMNRYYPEFVGAKGGLNPLDVGGVRFRNKYPCNNAADFNQLAFSKKGKAGKPLKNSSTYLNWKYYFFTHKSCLVCDDLFGELADATFMDAWLPEYIKDWKGNTIVLSRNTTVDMLIKDGIKKYECSADLISIDLVINSQLNRVKDRKTALKGRLYYLSRFGITLTRRVKPDKKIYKDNKRYIILCFKACVKSKQVWAKARFKSQSIRYFMKQMRYLLFQIKFNEKKIFVINILKKFFHQKAKIDPVKK